MMTDIMKRNVPFLSFSILVHGFIVFVMLWQWQVTIDVPLLGDTDLPMVNSYVMSEFTKQSQAIEQQQNRPTQIIKQKMDDALALQKVIPKKQLNPEATTATKAASASSAQHAQGVQTDALLALLHSAIQSQQHYPVSAQQMEREGKATVKFTLHPNGMVESVQLLHTSGTTSLDDAALAAVRAAAPFQHIEQYLNSTKEFSIEVVFQLT